MPKHYPSLKELKQLKTEVERIFGRKVLNTRDCEQLQQEINDYPIANTSLGLNTVRRFFNVIKSETRISNHTIDILCNYCGYDNLNNFIDANSSTKDYNETTNLNLIKILYDGNLGQKESKLFAKLHIEILEVILTNTSVFETVFPKLVRYPLFQEYVLSFHPMLDQLNKDWYMKRIRIFTRRSNITHLKVFGYALEFLRHFLNDELHKCETIIAEMQLLEKKLFDEHADKPYPQARLLVSMFIYFTHTGNKKTADVYKYKIINHLFDSVEKKSKQEQGNQFDFLMCVSDYLLLFEDYEFASDLTDLYAPMFANEHTTTSRQLNAYNTIVGLIKATCCFYSGKKEEAKKLLQNIKTSNLTFEFKKFYTLRYLLLQMNLGRNHSTTSFQTMQVQAATLTKELGFSRLQNQLNSIIGK